MAWSEMGTGVGSTEEKYRKEKSKKRKRLFSHFLVLPFSPIAKWPHGCTYVYIPVTKRLGCQRSLLNRGNPVSDATLFFSLRTGRFANIIVKYIMIITSCAVKLLAVSTSYGEKIHFGPLLLSNEKIYHLLFSKALHAGLQ